MSKFGLICHLWEDNQYLVPSLLPEMPLAKRDSMANGNSRDSDLRFKFKILPSGFFERLQASAIRRSQQYKNGSNVMESFLSRHSITLTFGNFKCQKIYTLLLLKFNTIYILKLLESYEYYIFIF